MAEKRATTAKLGGTKCECCQYLSMLVVVAILFSIIVAVIGFVVLLLCQISILAVR